MKRLISFAVVCLMVAAAMAVPAKRIKKTITLMDGTRKEVVLRGDETRHFYEAADGTVYQRNADGKYEKADREQVYSQWTKRLAARNEHRVRKAQQRRVKRKATWGAQQNPISGKKKGVVLLVNFKDKKFNAKYTQSFFNDYFNKEGFSQGGMAGSVHDYFKEASYGQFDLTFDVCGPYTLTRNMSYYGKNDASGNDLHPAEMVIEACKQAAAQGVDFSKYDWDGDGYVEQVFCIYAGYGEAGSGNDNTIWPHEWELESAAEYGDGTGVVTLNGVKINTYALSSELADGYGSTVCGIGTACHEFSHCMCIPDMYDTSDNENFGMDSWDLLDYGSYNGKNENGECPAAYTSYERWYCGWLTPTELTDGRTVTDMKPLTEAPEAYVIYNQNNRNEYYLLENRQQKGFDKCQYGHGLLMLHVDFDKEVWIENTVNNDPKHQRMTVIPADNQFKSGSFMGSAYATVDDLAGDPWPGTKNNTALTDTSKPAATLYNANSDGRKFMGKPIENITESSNGTISFVFDGGERKPTRIDAATINSAFPQQDGSYVRWGEVKANRNERIYDMAGRQLNHFSKQGIYVKNGKKYVK